jgi:hypothetical protein
LAAFDLSILNRAEDARTGIYFAGWDLAANLMESSALLENTQQKMAALVAFVAARALRS